MSKATINQVTAKVERKSQEVSLSNKDQSIPAEDWDFYHDTGFLTAMLLSTLGNYAQTGHFGGPLSYTPANVLMHLSGPANGGLRYDIRNPKHPFTDKFLLAGGHCIPTCYALWMILYEAMAQQEALHPSVACFKVAPHVAIRSVDCLGFRRTHEAANRLLADNGLTNSPLFEVAKKNGRGIRALMGHAESTDVTNDVNGGPSGIGVAKGPGRALFWDMMGAPEALKVIAFEGEFALTEGHAQELKTMALAQQVGKRFRLYFSDNNAGIDDAMIGGVINQKYADQYDYANQFYSYGWNVFEIKQGGDYKQNLAAFKQMEEWPVTDRRPMVVISKTVKGWWPASKDGKVGSVKQIIGHQSHPYGFKMNGEYYVALASTFEKAYGVKFQGLDQPPKTEKERIIQFKTNVDVIISVLSKKTSSHSSLTLGEWIVKRLMFIANTVEISSDRLSLKIKEGNPFKDIRLRPENLPVEPIEVSIVHPDTGKTITKKIELFQKPGVVFGARRSISEIGKWINYVTNNRWVTVAADLSGSINLENAHFTGHYDPVTNPSGTRLKAGIQECVNASTMCALASQTLSKDPKEHFGVWGASGTYGAFTPLMYIPMRAFSQQNQDSPFSLGVVTIIAGHSGPETAADARSHFGIFSPQVWTLFPRGQILNLHFWDYNDCSPAYFQAMQIAVHKKETAIIVIHVARPDLPVVDRSKFADSDLLAARKGLYLIREYSAGVPPMGTVYLQGASASFNTVSLLDTLEKEKINVRIVSVVSEDLLRHQPKSYQEFILPTSSRFDCMLISTMSKRIPPLANLGPLTEEYSLYSDFDDRWRTGGLEADLIKEARLDSASILAAIKRFAFSRKERLSSQLSAINSKL